MTTIEKPKRKRRTKAEIEADKLKAKEELFNKEYLPLKIPTILTVQQTAKLLKSTVKETREKCVNNSFICEPNESEKNQWNIPTYQFVEEPNFNKFVASYLRELDKINSSKEELETSKPIEEKPTKPVNKSTPEIVVTEPIVDNEEKPKRTRTIKNKKTEVVIVEEPSKEPIIEKKPKRTSKKKDIEEVKEKIKTDEKKQEPEKKLSAKEKEQLTRLEGFIQNKKEKKRPNTYEVPIVPEHAHYSVNDNVKLLNEFVLGEDCDEETLEYMDYYKKHLYGKKGVITKIEFAAKGHIIYTVYFEKYKEEMYCYHHYLEWLS